MHKMSESNLEAAFAGESQARMKYLVFADRAEREGYPEVARLFRAVSFAEQVHASGHFRTLGRIDQTLNNLATALGGETYEVEEMYPAFKAVAEAQNEANALRSNTWAMEAEKVHAGLYEKARQAVAAGGDLKLGTMYICETCGWTVEGDAPDKCPLCGARREKFVKY